MWFSVEYVVFCSGSLFISVEKGKIQKKLVKNILHDAPISQFQRKF